MKKELLQKLIDDNTVDGVVDYDAVFKVVDKSINDMAKLDKVKTDELKTQALKDATKQIIESLKIEDVDKDGDLDTLSKTLTTKITKLEDGLKDYTTKFEEQTQKNADLELTGKVSRYSEKNHQFAKLKYQEYKTEENTDDDVHKKIDEEYPEWGKDYKSTKGNALLDDNKFEATDVDKMAEAWGLKKPE